MDRNKDGTFKKGGTYTMSDSHKNKIREKLKGNTHGFKKGHKTGLGRKLSEETKCKMSNSHKGMFLNEKSHNWKGDEVSYRSLHYWVRNHKEKKEICEECKINKATEIANISGEYKRDVDDFKWLCRKCHYLLDIKSYEKDEFGRFTKKGN